MEELLFTVFAASLQSIYYCLMQLTSSLLPQLYTAHIRQPLDEHGHAYKCTRDNLFAHNPYIFAIPWLIHYWENSKVCLNERTNNHNNAIQSVYNCVYWLRVGHTCVIQYKRGCHSVRSGRAMTTVGMLY